MRRLIASGSMTYATRRLSAGDLFTASPRDARLLLALKRAKEAPDEISVVPPKAQPKAKAKSQRMRAPKAQPKAS